jgi:heme/copper-type cytochrome/quinol oxidase subunit 2
MRFVVLEVCACIVALLFLTTLTATAVHRAKRSSTDAHHANALTEYLWAAIPWVMIAAAALPAVRLIVAEH